jgi:selenocysteine lyase/cysteine desulfurase
MIDTASIRKIFPHTRKNAYFNAASNGPLPDPAYKLQDDHYKLAQDAAIGSQKELFDTLDNIAQNGAKIFGCQKSEVGFGFNTTFGINLAAFGLPLKKGDEVLLSDVDFPANVYPWLELRNRGINVKFVGNTNGFFDIDKLRKAISKKTKVLSLSFIQYFNGYKNDLQTIGEICKESNIFFVVDAIQGAGAEPMDVRKWNIDIASAGGQKWLLGSQGAGIYYVSQEVQKILIPPWRSWLSVDWQCNWTELNDYNRQFYNSARQYEFGTYPAAQVLSLDWTISYLLRQGIKNIQRHNHKMIDKLINYLRNEPNFRITSSLEKKHRSSILSFTSDAIDIQKLHQELLKARIITALREGAIRVSVHLYNNDSDINRLITSLKKAILKYNKDL